MISGYENLARARKARTPTRWRDDKARHGLSIGTPPQHNLRDLLDAILTRRA